MRSSIIFFIALATLMMTLVHAQTERSGTPQRSGLRIRKRGTSYGRSGPPGQYRQSSPGSAAQARTQARPATGGGGGGLGGGLLNGIPIVPGLVGL